MVFMDDRTHFERIMAQLRGQHNRMAAETELKVRGPAALRHAALRRTALHLCCATLHRKALASYERKW